MIIQSTGVKRVVIDSIMPISLYFKTDEERKTGFLKLIENLRKWGVTTLIVSEDTRSPDMKMLPTSDSGIERFVDGWLNIFYTFDEKNMERKRYIEVLKMKGVAHSTKACPVKIGVMGMEILSGEKKDDNGEGKGAVEAEVVRKEEKTALAKPAAPQVKKKLSFSPPPPTKQSAKITTKTTATVAKTNNKPTSTKAEDREEIKARLNKIKEKFTKKK